MTLPKLIVTPRFPALQAGKDNTVQALIRVQAPSPADDHKRSNLNLAIVIDRSGSMHGQPLNEAKRCAEFVVDRLGPEDRAALIAYDNRINRLVPLTKVTDKARFRHALNRMRSGGSTNLHGGWLEGAEQVSANVSGDSITRVILLSDGQANCGLIDDAAIADQCAKLAEAGVSTSTYGLSHHFNEELMIRMAKAGQGNSYYGETAEDLMDPFQEEFELLAALCNKRLRLSVESPQGVPVKILNKLEVDSDGDSQLPDLAYGSEAWALAQLKLPAMLCGKGDGRSGVEVMTVKVRMQDLDGVELQLPTETLSLPSVSETAWDAVEESKTASSRVNEMRAANLLDEATAAAERGDWDRILEIQVKVRQSAADDPYLGEVAANLEGLARRREREAYRKEARYTRYKMRRQLEPQMDGADASPVMHSPDAPMYLRRKVAQGKDERTKRQRRRTRTSSR
ncbi:MAG: VWA domain-containing protein [Rhodobacteraceae bacterium]|nr:VWA domain-containing protein [Paracoccaceae bacterium]